MAQLTGILARVSGRLEQLIWLERHRIPFSRLWVVRSILHGASGSTLVDIGCGDGETLRLLDAGNRFRSVGIDIFRPYLERCRDLGSHAYLVQADVRCIPLRDKSCDIVLALEVCEHLDKDEGFALVQDLERIAREMVIVSTPVGRYDQGPRNGNPFWAHRSRWEPSDFAAMGYLIRGSGVRGFGGDSGVANRHPILRLLHYPISFIASVVTYFVPALSQHMICFKRLHR